MYTLKDFFFDLPEELIAQYPSQKRDDSKLLVLNRTSGEISHKSFINIVEYFNRGDVLVFNNARVIHGRIYCRRKTGASLELVLTRKVSDRVWHAISNRTGRIKNGETIIVANDSSIEFLIKTRIGDILEIECSRALTDDVLRSIGELALPPYIKRPSDLTDNERYQTIYAERSGAVAAPTAGLHFTQSIFEELKKRGIEIVFTTLLVSWGTFQPVRVENISEHNMHSEYYILEDEAAEKINDARKRGKKITAVGTTSLRVLESTFIDGINRSGRGETDIFIHPPMTVKSIDSLITNFHTPESTLLMLVAAFAGYDHIMHAYSVAVENRYRFFSYGDAMLIL